jgi:GTP-binding protein
MFLDEVKLALSAGRGGDGSTSFHRAKYVAKGGPDGGNGGNGGNIILRADPNKNTLYHFQGKKIFKAGNGEGGSGQLKAGKAGVDLVLEVPIGTRVEDAETGELLADLDRAGAMHLVVRGGLGGKGNANFTTATRQAPRFAELGEPGEQRTIRFELKLVGDVGIIGLPSVGKSTLISVVSAVRPKIAEYHFTTLVPNLGVVSHKDQSFVVTDLPGLIAGASQGKGLGHRFLKHAERVRLFWQLVAADSATPVQDYRTICRELTRYNPELAKKPKLVLLSRADLLTPEQLGKLQAKLAKAAGVPVLTLSAPLHEGLPALLDQTIQQLAQLAAAEPPLEDELPVYRPHLEAKSKNYTVERKNKQLYCIDGPRINQIVVMSDLSNTEAVARVHDILHKIGATREITRLGAVPGVTIEIAGKRFEWWGIVR